MDHTDFEDLVSFLKSTFDVAAGEAPLEGNVRPEPGVREGRVLFERLLWIDHSRERVVVDLYEVDRVPSDCSRLSDDALNRMANKVGARSGQGRVIWRFPARERRGARDCPQTVVHVWAGEDANNAWQLLRSVCVDRDYFRVRVWTAEEFRVEHTRDFQVVDVCRNALDEARVLHPLHRATEVSRGSLSFRSFFYFGGLRYRCAHLCVCPFLAACSTASTICESPVQRQTLPSSACRIAS